MSNEKKTKASPKFDRVAPLASSIMSLPQPPLRKAEEYLDAYQSYAYTAISSIAQEVASIKLKLFRINFVGGKPKSTQIMEHAVLSFLRYSNPITTIYDTIEATQIYEELVGEAFWLILKDAKGIPQELWLLRPDWVKIIPSSTDIIESYIYTPGGVSTQKVTIPKANIIHFKYFNPKNPYRGKGSVQAAAMPLDIHTFAQEWNRNFFFNSAMPGLVFTTEKTITASTIQRFMAQWKAEHGGRTNTQKVAFLSGGFKLDRISLAPKDMDFSEQQKMMRDDILAVFRVPKTILGMTDDVNKANAEATTRAFMERVITPRMIKFVGNLNEFLLPMFGEEDLFFDFVDPSPEDVELKLKRYENGKQNNWLTSNEIRAEENLKPLDGGDDLKSEDILPVTTNPTIVDGDGEKGLIKLFKDIRALFIKNEKKIVKETVEYERPFKHMMPFPVKRPEKLKREQLTKDLTKDLTRLIGEMLKQNDYDKALKIQKAKEDKEKKDNDKDIPKRENELTKEERDNHWRRFVSKTDEWELAMKRISVDLFNNQEQIVLDNIKQSKAWKSSITKGKANSFIPSLAEMVKPWVVKMTPLIREIVLSSGRDALNDIDVDGELNLATQSAIEFLRVHATELMTTINHTTREKLKVTLVEGVEKGESIPELQKRVKDVFIEATTTRTEMIARSEVLRASNFGAEEAYNQSGVVSGKEWLTAVDDRVCPGCEAMDGKIVDVSEDYFKKGDVFTVISEGKKYSYNIDLFDLAYPPLHVSCRCTLIPVILEGKNISDYITHTKKVIEEKPKLDVGALTKDIVTYTQGYMNEVKFELDKKSLQTKKDLEKKYEVNKEKILEKAKDEVQIIIDKAEVDAQIIINQAKSKAKKTIFGYDKKGTELVDKAKEEAETIKAKAQEEAQKIISDGKIKTKKEKDDRITI